VSSVLQQNTARPIVFIGGLHRSGTSLVHTILRQHPDVSGFMDTGVPQDEGQHLQHVFPPAHKHGGPGLWGFDPASFLDESSPLCTAANGQLIWSAWSRYWDMSRAVLVEKSPPNLVRTRFLQSLFPNARFIIVVRHPIAVAMATLKWRPRNPKSLVDHWIICHRRFELDRPKISRLLVLRYEDLVQRPSDTIAEIYRFSGVGPHAPDVRVQSDLNNSYFREWRQHLETDPQAAANFETIRSSYMEFCELYDYPQRP
jgi:hypothetical protein